MLPTVAYFNGIQDWAIVLVVVVVLFGAKQIPQLAKGLGEGIREFKKSISPDAEPTETPAAAEATAKAK